MIQLDRISKSFGGRTLFSDLSWQLHPGRRIGLVGPNGAGKTTLFKILTGETEADNGRVIRPSGATIGLLPQDVGELGDESATAHVLRGRQDLLDLEARCAAIEAELPALVEIGDHDRVTDLSGRLAELQDTLQREGGPQLRSRAASILQGMGFSEDEQHRPCDTFSGGRRVRIVLSRLLLQRPTVLLMDEPTNHLDVPSIEWLEGFLGDYEGTVVVISHDRYFLNRLVNEVAGLEPEGLFVHPGTWDDYHRAREERLELLRARAEAQQREIAETERFIERFRAKATKARQVQSRVKALDKVERISFAEDKRAIHFRFPEAERSGRVVANAEGLGHRYGETLVFENTDLIIERGERIALVGPNGAGKSTLLRILAGDLTPTSGSLTLGHKVALSYFAQHSVEALTPSLTLLQEMESAATNETFPLCRGILGAFLFSGDDVEKRISVLSGGERNRVALARMLLRPSNFLLLDEPTNHLDMSSRDVLEEALCAFGGTVVFVSHDRHFINAVATRVVHVEHHSVVSYPGDYEYYRFKHMQSGPGGRGGDDATPGSVATGSASQSATDTRISRKEQRRLEAELRNGHRSNTRELRTRVADLERTCQELEASLAEIEATLADPVIYQQDPGRAAGLGAELGQLRKRLEETMEEWGEKAEALEGLDAAHEEALAALTGEEA